MTENRSWSGSGSQTLSDFIWQIGLYILYFRTIAVVGPEILCYLLTEGPVRVSLGMVNVKKFSPVVCKWEAGCGIMS